MARHIELAPPPCGGEAGSEEELRSLGCSRSIVPMLKKMYLPFLYLSPPPILGHSGEKEESEGKDTFFSSRGTHPLFTLRTLEKSEALLKFCGNSESTLIKCHDTIIRMFCSYSLKVLPLRPVTSMANICTLLPWV